MAGGNIALLFLTGQNKYWKHIWLQKHSGRRYSSAVFLHIISFVKDSEMFYHSDRFSAVISSVRLEQRVFFKMLRTWNFTVFSEINSFSDISPLESPSIIRLRTSFSRKESSYFWINAFRRSSWVGNARGTGIWQTTGPSLCPHIRVRKVNIMKGRFSGFWSL